MGKIVNKQRIVCDRIPDSRSMVCIYCFYTHGLNSLLQFVWVEALRHSQQFSVMSGRNHCFLGITSTFWEVNVSCSRIQHGDPSED